MGLKRKYGIVMLAVGILGALVFYMIKESNQPVYVSSSFGSGYMTDGWGDALPMFNFFIGLSVVDAIIGACIILFAEE